MKFFYKEYLKWMMEYGSYKKSLPIDEITFEFYSKNFCDESKTPAYLNLYRTLFTKDPSDWKPFIDKIITIPTLWILASHDPFVPPHMSSVISNKFSNIKIETLEECGHWIPEEQPEACHDVIVKFIKKLNIN